jgi:hypothetical protein
MATQSLTLARSEEIKLEYGQAAVFPLYDLEGKNCKGGFNGKQRVTYRSGDNRRLYLDAEDADDLDTRIRELGMQQGEEISITKIRMPRGGGHAIRVERFSDARELPASRPEPKSTTEALLEKSIEMARNGQRAGFREGAAPAFSQNAGVVRASNERVTNQHPNPAASASEAPPVVITPASVKLMASMCSLIQAMAEAKTYALRLGLDLTTEDLRALAVTAFISENRAGAR